MKPDPKTMFGLPYGFSPGSFKAIIMSPEQAQEIRDKYLTGFPPRAEAPKCTDLCKKIEQARWKK